MRKRQMDQISEVHLRLMKSFFDAKFFMKTFKPNNTIQALFKTTAFQTYLARVSIAQYDPNENFSESAYLSRNPDVAAAVSSGEFICGFHHWLVYGRTEGRLAPARRSRKLSDKAELISRAGVFDTDWYLRTYPQVYDAGVDPIEHYLTIGEIEGKRPAFLFDPSYYREAIPGFASRGLAELSHYVSQGAAEGRWPSALFDPDWYCRTYNVNPTKENPLAHYLRFGRPALASPNPVFDCAAYLAANADVAKAAIDPLEHWVKWGYSEGRSPGGHFDCSFYENNYLRRQVGVNPLEHYLRVGRKSGFLPRVPTDEPTISREVRRFSSQGARFEEIDRTIAVGRQPRALLFAFYLPQFHAIPENDDWWGKGFTDWRNIARGLPRFQGHYQPRAPRDLGYYDLKDPLVLPKQVALARDMGVTGFCFYYYWFRRQRLLEAPLNRFLADPSIDFPFLILWANESWTRRWDGRSDEVLIKQSYDVAEEDALLEDFHRHVRDPRYLRVEGRPLIAIYDGSAIPDCSGTLDRWRRKWGARFDSVPLFFMAQTFNTFDPRQFGFDGAIEFPPHKLIENIPLINREVRMLDWDFRGAIVDYNVIVERSIHEPAPDYPICKSVFPSWDNNARRQIDGLVIANSSPDNFARWLEETIKFALLNPVGGLPIVFVNAWNEWAEGAYLEPDLHYGGAYLNALARVVTTPT